MMSTLSYTLGQLAAHVGAEVRGDADLPIRAWRPCGRPDRLS